MCRSPRSLDFGDKKFIKPCCQRVDRDPHLVPRPTQPFVPSGSVNEDQLRLGRQRQVRFIPLVDKRVGVQCRWNCDPLTTPGRFSGEVPSRRGAMSSVFYLCLYLTQCAIVWWKWDPTVNGMTHVRFWVFLNLWVACFSVTSEYHWSTGGQTS